MGGHKVDRRWSRLLRSHAEVTLAFAVLVIHQNDHPAATNLGNRFFYSRKWHGALLYHPDFFRQLLDLAEFGHCALTKTNPKHQPSSNESVEKVYFKNPLSADL